MVVNSRLNYSLAAVHFALGVGVWIWFATQTKAQPEFLNPSLYDIAINDSNVEANKAWNLNIKAIQGCILAYFFITAFFHLFYATNGFGSGIYSSMLNNGNNWVRWIEYAITATLMIFVISLISGMKDYTFVILTLCIFPVLMLQGQTVERALTDADCTGATRISDILVPTITGWVILLSVFALIIRAFNQRIAEVKASGLTVPKWLYFVVYPMLVWFASFGVVQVVQIYKTSKGTAEYFNYERAYLWLSLFSKAFLGLFVAFGLTRRNV